MAAHKKIALAYFMFLFVVAVLTLTVCTKVLG